MNNYYYYPFVLEHQVASGFRTSHRPNHRGVDFAWNVDEGPNFIVLASADGIVDIRAFEDRGAGKWLRIVHAGDERSVYMHLEEQLVNQGQFVARGQQIGIAGSTGGVDPHLHFEIHDGPNNPVDPIPLLQWPAEPQPIPDGWEDDVKFLLVESVENPDWGFFLLTHAGTLQDIPRPAQLEELRRHNLIENPDKAISLTAEAWTVFQPSQ